MLNLYLWMILLFLLLHSLAVVNKESFSDGPLFEDFRQLLQEDDSLNETIVDLFRTYHTTSPNTWDILSGSATEGSSTAKIFFKNHQFEEKINRELEVDIERIILEIPAKYKHCIQPVPNRTGFLRILFDRTTCNYSTCFKYRTDDIFLRMANEQSYLRPYYLKQMSAEHMISFIKKTSFFVREITSIFLNKDFSSIRVDFLINVTKATSFMNIAIFISNSLDMSISLDKSFLVKLHWVPKVVTEWIKRRKNWPPLHLISDQLQSTYAIAKPSKEEKSNMETTEWRYSFSYLEHKLVSLRSQQQKLIYFIFKAMFYRWLKPIDPQNLDSFLAKTTMFWFCERYPPRSKYWGQNDRHSINRILKTLFEFLYAAFQRTHFLMFYFIPEINILDHVPLTTRRKVGTMLLKLKLNPEPYVPRKLRKYIETVHEFRTLLKRIETLLLDIGLLGIMKSTVNNWGHNLLYFFD